jgi:hypothetical protein
MLHGHAECAVPNECYTGMPRVLFPVLAPPPPLLVAQASNRFDPDWAVLLGVLHRLDAERVERWMLQPSTADQQLMGVNEALSYPLLLEDVGVCDAVCSWLKFKDEQSEGGRFCTYVSLPGLYYLLAHSDGSVRGIVRRQLEGSWEWESVEMALSTLGPVLEVWASHLERNVAKEILGGQQEGGEGRDGGNEMGLARARVQLLTVHVLAGIRQVAKVHQVGGYGNVQVEALTPLCSGWEQDSKCA